MALSCDKFKQDCWTCLRLKAASSIGSCSPALSSMLAVCLDFRSHTLLLRIHGHNRLDSDVSFELIYCTIHFPLQSAKGQRSDVLTPKV